MPSDVWSLGAMAFELLVGEVPFGEEGGLNQESGLEIPDIPGQYSQDLKDIIERCLSEVPSERPFVEDLENIAASHLSSSTPLRPETKPKKGKETLRENESRLEKELRPAMTTPESASDPTKPKVKLFDMWFWIAILAGILSGTLLAFL